MLSLRSYTVGARVVRVIAVAFILFHCLSLFFPPSPRTPFEGWQPSGDDGRISGSANGRRTGDTAEWNISLANALSTGRRGRFSFHRVTHTRAGICDTRVRGCVRGQSYVLITRFLHNRISARSLARLDFTRVSCTPASFSFFFSRDFSFSDYFRARIFAKLSSPVYIHVVYFNVYSFRYLFTAGLPRARSIAWDN